LNFSKKCANINTEKEARCVDATFYEI
jgi:hypothetical protein